MEYNGGSVIAMVGKDCVAIASDLRLGVQSLSISSNFQKASTSTLLCCHGQLPTYRPTAGSVYRFSLSRTAYS